MRLYEWEAKALLARADIPVPAFTLIASGTQARRSADLFGPVVIKAQVLRGGRGKAGLVRFADTPGEAERVADELLAVLDGESKQLLVEERVEIAEELFLGVLYDPEQALPMLVLSRHGGVEVESHSDSITRIAIEPQLPIRSFVTRTLAAQAGFRGSELRVLSTIGERLVTTFLKHDATLLEINPLARRRDGGFVALDAHMALDTDAFFRQESLNECFELDERSESDRLPTPLESEARAIDELDHRGVAGRVIEFDGELALIIGGGGASLTVFDAVREAGGRPANYCEVGGNPSVAKVEALTSLFLTRINPRSVAVVMNVVSNTRADLVARGVIKGCLSVGRDPATTISIFRVPGAWEDESRELLAHYGVRSVDRSVGVDEAARLAVSGASGG